MKLICYLSNGYPNLETTIKLAREYAKSGCDVIEIDFPAKNPYLESPYISERMSHALDQCNDYEQYMKTMERIVSENSTASFIILVYERTIHEIGADVFASFCLDHHLKDIIYVGTEFPDIRAFLIEKGINVASYIRFHLPKDDIDAARQTNGFIYLQAKPGDSPIHENQTLESNIKYLREILKFNRPVYCGVGISTEEDVRMVRMAKADGVFVGSVILKLQDDIEALKQKIANLKQNTY